MDAEPKIPWARIAAFIRQHTHDVRNGLNSLDLEAAVMQELAGDAEVLASAARLREQVRCLSVQMRSLAALFEHPQPLAAPLAAHELMLIWREQHAAVAGAPEVNWVDQLGAEEVTVDVEMMAAIFRELLTNAAEFSQGARVTITALARGRAVIFEMREPKEAAVDASAWGEPFVTTHHGYGLGLWMVRRLVAANGAAFVQRYMPHEAALVTQIVLAVTSETPSKQD
jgi:signal transduction histidine kinase